MSETNELWHAVAGGLLSSWEAKLAAIWSQADRDLQERRGVWPGWLIVTSYGAMGHTISDDALGLLFDEIPDRVSDPTIRDQIAAGKPTFVGNPASDGTTLTGDDPGPDVTTMVYSWDSSLKEWEEVGTLADNSTPPSGTYVLVNVTDSAIGLPSPFLTISQE